MYIWAYTLNIPDIQSNYLNVFETEGFGSCNVQTLGSSVS
jgi:hypothetical protein